MASQKQQLRTEMKVLVHNLDKRWIKAASKVICQKIEFLLATEFQNSNDLLCYIPFFPGEVLIEPLIESEIPKRKVFLPSLIHDRRMKFLEINDTWKNIVDKQSFDLDPTSGASEFSPRIGDTCVCIIPGLAFDKTGNRLGRGKGYYDQFLGLHRTTGIKIGICWDLQLLEGGQVPRESHDVPMDFIVTESQIIRLKELRRKSLLSR